MSTDLKLVSMIARDSSKGHLPSILTVGLNNRHLPPRSASVGSGSLRTEPIRSILSRSLFFSSELLILEIFFKLRTLPAASGILLLNRARSKAAPMTRGGVNIASSDITLSHK